MVDGDMGIPSGCGCAISSCFFAPVAGVFWAGGVVGVEQYAGSLGADGGGGGGGGGGRCVLLLLLYFRRAGGPSFPGRVSEGAAVRGRQENDVAGRESRSGGANECIWRESERRKLRG